MADLPGRIMVDTGYWYWWPAPNELPVSTRCWSNRYPFAGRQ